MYISLDWISDYVDLSEFNTHEIADRLTLATAEVEGVEILKRSVAGVLVGEIVKAEPLKAEEGKTLTACTVDCGDRQYATACGAPNARVGLKAPFAPAGVTLAGDVVIEETEMAGHKSEGILCSAAELGMSRWHEGLLECPASIENGTPIAEFIPEEDVLIEVDNKSLTHRPDLWGHYGFAREFAAIFRKPLKPLKQTDLSQYNELPAYALTIDDLEACPCYGCIEFESDAPNMPAPLVMQRRLHALGQRTMDLMVDVTNYCMLEIGQPTHAFDGDRLKAVRVAMMGKDATFTTLDEQERQLLPDDLLIWNEKEPVALAGVMGGMNSEVGPTTKKLLLESANFKAAQVRRTSVRLDLRTDAAQRFEKSQPPANVKTAVARILHLLDEAGATPEVTSRFTVEGDLAQEYRHIELQPGHLDAMAGVRLSRDEVEEILSALGFTVEHRADGSLCVGVPPYRSVKDLSIEPDIAEEVLRVYGYGRIEPIMPSMPIKPLHVEKSIRLEHKARKLLAGSHGFLETHNYGWTDDTWLAKIGYEPGDTICLRNPAAQPCKQMRTTLIPNLLQLVPRNRTHRDAFRIFEIGNVYLPGGPEKRIELSRLAGISYQQSPTPSLEDHFRRIKGAIEDLGALMGDEPFTFVPINESSTPWQQGRCCVEILQGEARVGVLGYADKKLMDVLAPDGGQVIWFEIEMDKLGGQVYPTVQFAPTPRFPGSWQDFSMVWDVDRGYAELTACLDGFTHPLLMKREFLVAYKGKGLEKGLGSYSFRYWIGSLDHTLTSDEIEDFRTSILAFLEKNNIPLR